MNRIAPPPSPTDAVIGVLVALALGCILLAVWWTAAGRFAQEPSPTTWISGDGDAVEVVP